MPRINPVVRQISVRVFPAVWLAALLCTAAWALPGHPILVVYGTIASPAVNRKLYCVWRRIPMD